MLKINKYAYIYVMKIYVDSVIPCNLFYEGVQYETPTVLSVFDAGRVQISVLPAYPERFSSYTLVLGINNSTLQEMSGGAKAVRWGMGMVEVMLTPPIVQSHYTPDIISQKRLKKDLVTLYDDGRKKLMLEGSAFFNFDLPENLTEEVLKAKDLDFGCMVSVKGRIDEKEYLLALLLENNQWRIMHEVVADKVETTTTGVKTYDIIPSMMRYERREFYKPFSMDPIREYVPTIRHEYPDELIPYLFLEDVFLKNENCTSHLHPDIGLDMDGIIEFFGDVDTAVSPKIGDYPIEVIAVYNSKNRIATPDLYKFVVEKGKIVNIIHLLACN